MAFKHFAQNALTLLVLLLLAGAAGLAEIVVSQQARKHELEHATEQLERTRLQIEKLIARELHAVQALATYMAVHPQLGTPEFEAFVARLINDRSPVRHLAVAPDLVVRYVYPLAGNEQVIGRDYRTLPHQLAGVMQAVASAEPVLSGPVALVQGGVALIARSAVYLDLPAGGQQLWGLVAAVIDVDRFYAQAGLVATEDGLEYALRGQDGTGAAGAVFFGEKAVLADDPVIAEVGLPNGTWQLAARPLEGWSRSPPVPVYFIRALALTLALAVIVLAVRRHRHERARAAALRELNQAQHDFRVLFDNANDAIFVSDAASLRIVDLNAEAERHLGLRRTELLGRRLGDFHAPDGAAFDEDAQVHAQVNGSSITRTHHRRADGSVAAVEVSTRLVPRETGNLFISIVRDLSERERTEAALRQSQQDLSNSIESLGEGFALWDANDCLQLFNRRLIDISPRLENVLRTGISFAELAAHTYDAGIIVTDRPREEWLEERLRQHRDPGAPIELRNDTGRIVRMAEYRTPDGHIVGIYTDITEIKQAEEHIRHRAYFDALTELPNRENFMNQLSAAILMHERAGTVAALLFVDLDRFKNINDTMGHATGDLLLQEAGRRICAAVRQTDTVARFGGDEFTVLLRDIGDATNAARVAEGIIERLAASFELGGHVFYCGASIGISICPLDSRDPQVLLRNADTAMYQAKAVGRSTYRFFTATMTLRAEQFVTMEKDLRRAIGSDEFSLAYQPVIRIADGALGGAEALLRWRHPQRGLVPPSEFIPIAEETRLINELGAWALHAACGDAQAWCTRARGALPRLAVNVSSRQFFGGFNGDFVRGVLDETGFPPSHLTFEMTESLLIEEDERIVAILTDFRDMGIGLAVDDFGTGYSALSYLRRFPVTTLKIDRAFVRDIETDPSDANLVESIIAMARALHIEVVAEGVETAGQLRLLGDMGCTYAQGFLYGRPMPAADFEHRHMSAPAAADIV